MLAMIALFPTRHFGIELGAILLLFTSAAWNMAFSFYSSIKSIPRELREVADINASPGCNASCSWSCLTRQLAGWNSVMSVAGAWFALMYCEMFHFGTKDFRLPGSAPTADCGRRGKRPRHRVGHRHHGRIIVAID